MHRYRGSPTGASAFSARSMATRPATISTASAAPLWVLAHRGDLVQVVPDAGDLPACARARPRPQGPSRSGCAPSPGGISADNGHAGGLRLGSPVGGLARREANGDQDRAASSHRDAPSRGERGRRPRPRNPPERGSVGVRRGGVPRLPTVIPWVGWLSHLNGARHARPSGLPRDRDPVLREILERVVVARHLHQLYPVVGQDGACPAPTPAIPGPVERDPAMIASLRLEDASSAWMSSKPGALREIDAGTLDDQQGSDGTGPRAGP